MNAPTITLESLASPPALKVALARGADPNTVSGAHAGIMLDALAYCCDHAYLESIEVLLDYSEKLKVGGDCVPYLTPQTSDKNFIRRTAISRMLIEAFPQLVDLRDGQGAHALYHAINRGNHVALNILLAAGADPDAIVLDDPISKPRTLHLAASRGDAQAIRILLDAGADPRQKNGAGIEVLHDAVACNNSADILRELVNAGVDPNESNQLGLTPLMQACMRPQSLEAAHALLELGAVVDRQWLEENATANARELVLSFKRDKNLEEGLDSGSEPLGGDTPGI